MSSAFRSLALAALVATAVGRFTAPANSAYPYYDDQAKAWEAGVGVEVTPATGVRTSVRTTPTLHPPSDTASTTCGSRLA